MKKRVFWGLGAACSLWLSWLAIHGPEEPIHQATPLALARPPNKAETQAVRNMVTMMQRQLDAAKTRTGAWPALSDLEGTDPTGQPWLPEGLPDNPLVPGISNVADGCTDDSAAQVDWLYCATNGRIRPGGQVVVPAAP